MHKTMDALVSIIITCYNQEKFIAKAIQSVLAQTYKHWECIVVDDGSRDGSVNKIEKFSKTDDRIKLLKQKNQGVSIARNNGFKKAKGEYIQFLDGDDTLLPQKLKKQIEYFKRNDTISICVSNHQYYYAKSKEFKYFQFDPISEKPFEQIIYNWQNGVAFPNHAPLYKRNIWENTETPFREEYKGRSEDWVFNVLLALKNIKYGFLDEVLCNYHVQGESFTSDIYNSASSAIHAAYYLIDKIPDKYKPDFLEKTIRKSFDRYLESKRPEILRSSGNWILGNFITKPFIILKNVFSKK